MPQPIIERTLAVHAGTCRLAIPLTSVRQILDAGGETASAPEDPRALGVAPTSLARVLDLEPAPGRPALLLFDSHLGPVLISVCRLDGIVDTDERLELPATAPIRWPGLLSHGILAPDAPGDEAERSVVFVLDPVVLIGVIEAAQIDDDEALANID